MNPLKLLRIWNGEVCLCGSGKKHIDCCKNKEIIEAQASKKPLEVQVMEMMKKSMKKCCTHPDQARCKGKINLFA